MPPQPPPDSPSRRSSEHERQHRITLPAGLPPTLYEILDATILVLHGKFGTIQLYDPERRVLEMVAQRGFPTKFLEAMDTISIDIGMAAPRAIRSRTRVIVPDVNRDPDYQPYRPLAALAGFTDVLGDDRIRALDDAWWHAGGNGLVVMIEI